jgi:hypothetical protein
VKVERRAATPIAGAIAGILFAVLFGVSVTILNNTMAGVANAAGHARVRRPVAGAANGCEE